MPAGDSGVLLPDLALSLQSSDIPSSSFITPGVILAKEIPFPLRAFFPQFASRLDRFVLFLFFPFPVPHDPLTIH